MHCGGCGLIIGRDTPADQCRCPRCDRVLRLWAFYIDDGYDRHRAVPAEATTRRLVGAYVSESMLRLLLATRGARPAWEPWLIALEEARLKTFAESLGFAAAALYRDPGPVAAEERRPFARIESDLRDKRVNTILVSDFERVTRKELHTLHELAGRFGGEVVSVAPHLGDLNLAHDNIDFDHVPDREGDNPVLERLWSPAAAEATRKLVRSAGWHWTRYAADVLARVLGREAVQSWRAADPACQERPWKEVLTAFAVARARRAGDLAVLEPPPVLDCSLCRRPYLEAALPPRLMELVAGRGGYCRYCLEQAFFLEDGDAVVGPAVVDSFADAERAVEFFRALDRDRFHALVARVVERRQDAARRGAAGPPSNLWLGVLAELGFLRHLGEAVRADAFFRAADGHLTGSLGVALIDNWLAARGIAHRPDVRYPIAAGGDGTAGRADFGVGDVLVEYLGMRGRDEMKKRIEERLGLAAGRVTVIGVYAQDLVVPETLERKLGALAKGELEAEEERTSR